MIQKILMLGFATMVFGLFPTVASVRAESSEKLNVMTVKSAKIQSRRFGPYATIRRANEVANYARRLGYNSKVIYSGGIYFGYTRQYYVDVWR